MKVDITLGRKILKAISDKSYSKMPRPSAVRAELENLVQAGLIIMPTTFWVRLTPSGNEFVSLAASELRWNTAQLLIEQRKGRPHYLMVLTTLREIRDREKVETPIG